METPSSITCLTRSQASAASHKTKQEDALSRSRVDRSALLDITNDSPTVGLATSEAAEKTPASSEAKKWVRAKQTPWSGEALLREQVKTLLQKVEEGADMVNKVSFVNRPPVRPMLGVQISPGQLLAPTPANTPQIPSLSVMVPPATKDVPNVQSEAAEDFKQELSPLGECLINRALLFDDSPGKSEMSNSSTISYQGSASNCREKSYEDDSSSAWSLQVNPSIQEDDEEGIEDFEGEEETEGYYEGEEGEDVVVEVEECYDDLCEVLMKMSVNDNANLPEFEGKHTRFIYNSDGEIEGEEEVVEKVVSPCVVLCLPVPEIFDFRRRTEF